MSMVNKTVISLNFISESTNCVSGQENCDALNDTGLHLIIPLSLNLPYFPSIYSLINQLIN